MKTHALSHSNRGSALLVALISVGVLIALGATSFIAINHRYRAVHQAGSWHEALLTAEGGVDMALTEIRKKLKKGEVPFAASDGWESAGGVITRKMSDVIVRETDSAEGVRTSTIAEITVDEPSGLVDPVTHEQWYRIRVTGICELPAARSANNSALGGEKLDVRLRKFDFRFDHFNQAPITVPQATRRIEAIVAPSTAARDPLFGVKTIDMTDHNIVVDSYDSRDPNKSTNGFYDPTKQQWNGNISTNGTVINAGNAHIYGTASTHGGSVLNNDNVTGNIMDYPGGYLENPNRIRTDFYREVVPVAAPEVTATAGTPTDAITSTTVIQASAGDPTQVKVPSINLSGQDVLHIKGASDGSTTYAQLIISGNLSIGGQGQIILDPGVKVRIFVSGDTDIAGNGVLNPNTPLAFQLYGLDRPPKSDGTPDIGTIKIAGNGGFRGVVYGPNYDIEMKGGGNEDSIYGAFTGNTIKLTGVQSVHYDEALAEGSIVTGYNIVSWFEDER